MYRIEVVLRNSSDEQAVVTVLCQRCTEENIIIEPGVYTVTYARAQ
jgi:hypothetical protein